MQLITPHRCAALPVVAPAGSPDHVVLQHDALRRDHVAFAHLLAASHTPTAIAAAARLSTKPSSEMDSQSTSVMFRLPLLRVEHDKVQL